MRPRRKRRAVYTDLRCLNLRLNGDEYDILAWKSDQSKASMSQLTRTALLPYLARWRQEMEDQ